MIFRVKRVRVRVAKPLKAFEWLSEFAQWQVTLV